MTQIRDAVKAGAELTVRILNYTKTGRPFWNMFTLAPMRDSDGHARFYVGVQVRWLDSGGGFSCRCFDTMFPMLRPELAELPEYPA